MYKMFCYFCRFISNRELDDAFAFLHGHVVPVQEVHVQACLQGTTQDLSPAVEAVHLVPVHPVQNVKEPVESECGDVVRCDVLHDSDFVEHDDLGHKRNAFQPKTVAPRQLPSAPARLNNAGENEGGREEDLEMREVVSECVVGL